MESSLKVSASVMSQNEVELLINNSLLKQEQRIAEKLSNALDVQTNKLTASINNQNEHYSAQIINMNKDITRLEIGLNSVKARLVVWGAACATLGGIIGFFVGNK